MTKVRLLVAGVTTLLLASGYIASQVAYLNGSAPEYAARVDSPPVVMLSLVLFLTMLALFFIPDREEPKP